MQRAREAQAGRASSLSQQRGASKGAGKGTVRRQRRVRYDRWLHYGMNIEQDGLVRANTPRSLASHLGSEAAAEPTNATRLVVFCPDRQLRECALGEELLRFARPSLPRRPGRGCDRQPDRRRQWRRGGPRQRQANARRMVRATGDPEPARGQPRCDTLPCVDSRPRLSASRAK